MKRARRTSTSIGTAKKPKLAPVVGPNLIDLFPPEIWAMIRSTLTFTERMRLCLTSRAAWVYDSTCRLHRNLINFANAGDDKPARTREIIVRALRALIDQGITSWHSDVLDVMHCAYRYSVLYGFPDNYSIYLTFTWLVPLRGRLELSGTWHSVQEDDTIHWHATYTNGFCAAFDEDERKSVTYVPSIGEILEAWRLSSVAKPELDFYVVAKPELDFYLVY